MKNSFKINIVIIIIILIIILTIAMYCIKLKKEEDFLVIEELNQSNCELFENINNDKNIDNVEELNIIIHITGEVKFPGVVELKENSRIVDAIEAAGGETDNADLNQLNLAYILSDGDKIYVPNKNDLKENSIQSLNETLSNNEKNKLNLNIATIENLIKLPGVGESTANKIIEYRSKNGKFKNIEELKNISGIGESKYLKLKDYVYIK